MSERVFVDSSAYYALADARDDNHALAVATAQRLGHDQHDLYTSNFIVAETHGLILNRLHRDSAQRVLDELYASTTRIVRATEGDETVAREIIRGNHDKEYSLTDAISMAIMRRLHIRRVWSYDHHFDQAGFTRIE